MAFDAYLKLTGVDGESTTKGFEKWIGLDSFQWGAHNTTSAVGTGKGAGRAEISEFSVTKQMDKASPKLFQSCCGGKHYDKASLYLRKAGGGKEAMTYLKFEFAELFLTDVQWSGASGSHGGDTPMEHLNFSFGKVEIAYFPQKADGSPDGQIKAGWDLKQGIAAGE